MLRQWLSLSIVAVMVVSGCATSYQKHGATGGYNEQKISDSAYIVSFNGNGFASKDRVWYFWIYRCAELTSQQGYKLFTLRQNRAAAAQEGAGNFVPAVYRPGEQGGLMKVRGGTTTYIYTPGTTVTSWNSSATVLMYPQPLPQEVIWALDAQKVLDQLKPYVTSNGNAPAPARADLFQTALVAHSRIDISHIKVSAAAPVTHTDPVAATATSGSGPATPATAVAAAPALQPRSVSSIRAAVDFSHMLMLQTAYHQHASRTLDIAGGQIVLGFVIWPNGPVGSVHVVSTTFTDREFVALVLEIVRRMDFGPMNAAETRVAELPISFSPQT